ncbi:MAG: hypothetical protein KAT71_02885 [Gammaproteobacteria bacterium]|nr:hypothetical protein [Gammaproteobacteria bacterium]
MPKPVLFGPDEYKLLYVPQPPKVSTNASGDPTMELNLKGLASGETDCFKPPEGLTQGRQKRTLILNDWVTFKYINTIYLTENPHSPSVYEYDLIICIDRLLDDGFTVYIRLEDADGESEYIQITERSNLDEYLKKVFPATKQQILEEIITAKKTPENLTADQIAIIDHLTLYQLIRMSIDKVIAYDEYVYLNYYFFRKLSDKEQQILLAETGEKKVILTFEYFTGESVQFLERFLKDKLGGISILDAESGSLQAAESFFKRDKIKIFGFGVNPYHREHKELSDCYGKITRSYSQKGADSLTITDNSAKSIIEDIQNNPDLRHIDILTKIPAETSLPPTLTHLKILCDSCSNISLVGYPNLKHLTSFAYIDINAPLPALRSITSTTMNADKKKLSTLNKIAPGLKELYTGCNYDYDEQDIDEANEISFKGLIILNLFEVTAKHISFLLKTTPYLRELTISKLNGSDRIDIPKLLELKKLYIHCGNLDNFKVFVESAPNLRELTVKGLGFKELDQLLDTIDATLNKLPNLLRLNVSEDSDKKQQEINEIMARVLREHPHLNIKLPRSWSDLCPTADSTASVGSSERIPSLPPPNRGSHHPEAAADDGVSMFVLTGSSEEFVVDGFSSQENAAIQNSSML